MCIAKRNDLQNGIGALKSESAGTPWESNVTTLTPNGLSSSRKAAAQPSTPFLAAVKAISPSPELPAPKNMNLPL